MSVRVEADTVGRMSQNALAEGGTGIDALISLTSQKVYLIDWGGVQELQNYLYGINLSPILTPTVGGIWGGFLKIVR